MKELAAEVYIAGPLFNTEENTHNRRLAQRFRDAGYSVFNPIEDGIEGAVDDMKTETELAESIYTLDRSRVRGSRIFVANLNGAQVDDGTAVEIGIASESQRERQEYDLDEGVEVLIGYFNDTRTLMANLRRNPMVLGPFLPEPNRVFSTPEEIILYALEHYPPERKETDEAFTPIQLKI